MPNEFVFDPIGLPGAIQLRDSQTVLGERRRKAIPVFHEEFHRLVEAVTRDVNEPPGCHSMFFSKDVEAFIKQQGNRDGVKTFRDFRKALKIERVATGLSHSGSRTMLAWENGIPVGGVVLYLPTILGTRRDGVIEFAAHIGPFMVDQRLSSRVMVYLLENEVTASHAARPNEVKPLTMQLVEWRFPTGRSANRWRSDNGFGEPFIDELKTQREDFATDEGITYRTLLRKRIS